MLSSVTGEAALDFRQVAASSSTAFAASATVLAVNGNTTINHFMLLAVAVRASAVISAANSHCYFCCATIEMG